MLAPEEIRLDAGVAQYFSTRCPARPAVNEDGLLIVAWSPRRGVLAVADGFGGLPAGAEAANCALNALQETVEGSAGAGSGLRDAILDGIERANQSVRALGVGAATTLAVVEIEGDQIRPYHVGDSEILVIGRRGKVKMQTLAHGPVGYAIEAGWLERKEALHHEDRHVVSNMVGNLGMRIDVGSSLSLDPRDTVLVASDGVYDNLHLEEIIECVRKGTLADAASTLADACLARMTSPASGSPCKPDDLTFILFRPDERGDSRRGS